MKFPETADDVEREILISSEKYRELGDLRIRQLIQILPKVDPEIVVEGVIRVFEKGDCAEKYSQYQEFAGRVLESINPKTQTPAKDVLLRILKTWDRSIEQFPVWLRNNYGLEKLEKTFAGLEVTEFEKDKLKTVKWWLRID